MKKQWLIRTTLIASVVIVASAFAYSLTPAKNADKNTVSISQTITKGEKMDMVSPKCNSGKSEEKSEKKCNSGTKSDSTMSKGKNMDVKKDSKSGQGKCNDSKKASDNK